ncbi:MAG: DUF4340 domain-containing protein [Steroidobacterales bacterium]
MSLRRFIGIMAAAIVAIAAALLFGNQHPGHSPGEQRTVLLPLLGKQLNDVTGVTIRKGAAQPTVSLHRIKDRWTVTQRGDYPADTPKLRRLLLALANARVIEQKTSDPANYHTLGVDDPAAPEASGTEVVIETATGSQALLVGKASGDGNFVRLRSEARSLLVAPGIFLEWEPRDWIDARLLGIKAAEIRQIEVKPAKGPAAKLPESAFGALAQLSAEDVAPAGDVDFSKASVATVTRTDGSVVGLSGAQAGDKRWLMIGPTSDAALSDRVHGRAFQIASSSYDAIFKP